MTARVDALLNLLATKGHIVAVSINWTELFGYTWQPVCLDCDYVGPFVPEQRAHAIAAEHRAKMAGTWEPVR